MPEKEIVSEVSEAKPAEPAAPVETNPIDVIGQISKEDLQSIRDAQQAAREAKLVLEKAELVAENANLKFENILKATYLRYSMKPNWTLELGTGNVKLPVQPVQAEEKKA
jgi:enamine deaminase RidA (YjgF/YER057c/UK114 family)